MKKFPEIFDFLKKTSTEEAIEVKYSIDTLNEDIIENFKIIYENIDLTKFRDDIDIQKAIEIINWAMLGFSEREVEKIESFDNIGNKQMKEWRIYSDILKKCFYKK